MIDINRALIVACVILDFGSGIGITADCFAANNQEIAFFHHLIFEKRG